MRLKLSTFNANILTLLTGTTIAQAIPIALAPILTRLYTPDDFAVLALYVSAVKLAVVLITLKYDQAIIITKQDQDSKDLIVLAVFINIIITLVITLILFLCGNQLISLIDQDLKDSSQLRFYIYFVPLTAFLMGNVNIFNLWFNRKSSYKKMSKTKVVDTTTMTISQIGLSVSFVKSVGLLLGFIVGKLLALSYLCRYFFKTESMSFKKSTKVNMLRLLRRYRHFPLFTVPAEFVNVAANQIPVFLIGKYFGSLFLGNYALMERILSAPIGLLGHATSEVFRQEASADYAQQGNCQEVFLKTLKTLLVLALAPSILLFFLSPILFSFIFGAEWKLAGEFAQILSILFFFRFIASPLSYMFIIAEKQALDMIWQGALLAFTVVAFLIGDFYNDIRMALILFTAFYSLLYLINIYMAYIFSKGRNFVHSKHLPK